MWPCPLPWATHDLHHDFNSHFNYLFFYSISLLLLERNSWLYFNLKTCFALKRFSFYQFVVINSFLKIRHWCGRECHKCDHQDLWYACQDEGFFKVHGWSWKCRFELQVPALQENRFVNDSETTSKNVVKVKYR